MQVEVEVEVEVNDEKAQPTALGNPNQSVLEHKLEQLHTQWLSWARDAVDSTEAPRFNTFANARDHVLWWLYETACVFDEQHGYIHWLDRPLSRVMNTLEPAIRASRRSDQRHVANDVLIRDLYTDSENMYAVLTDSARRHEDRLLYLRPAMFQQRLEALSVYELISRTEPYRRTTRASLAIHEFPDQFAGFGEAQFVTWSALLTRDQDLDHQCPQHLTGVARHKHKQSLLLQQDQEIQVLNTARDRATQMVETTLATALENGRFRIAPRLQEMWVALLHRETTGALQVLEWIKGDLNGFNTLQLVDLGEVSRSRDVHTRYTRFAKQALRTLLSDSVEDGKVTRARELLEGRTQAMLQEWCPVDVDGQRDVMAIDAKEMSQVVEINLLSFQSKMHLSVLNAYRALFDSAFTVSELIRRTRLVEPKLFLRSSADISGVHAFDELLTTVKDAILDADQRYQAVRASIDKNKARVVKIRKRWYTQAVRQDALRTLKRALLGISNDLVPEIRAGVAITDAELDTRISQHLGLAQRRPAAAARQRRAPPPPPQPEPQEQVLPQVLPIIEPDQQPQQPQEQEQQEEDAFYVDSGDIDWIADTEAAEIKQTYGMSMEQLRTSSLDHAQRCIEGITKTLLPQAQRMYVVPPVEVAFPGPEQNQDQDLNDAEPVYGRQLQHRHRGQDHKRQRVDVLSQKPSLQATQQLSKALKDTILEPARRALNHDNDAVIESACEADYHSVEVLTQVAPMPVHEMLDAVIPQMYPCCVSLMYYTRYRDCFDKSDYVQRPEWYRNTRHELPRNRNRN